MRAWHSGCGLAARHEETVRAAAEELSAGGRKTIAVRCNVISSGLDDIGAHEACHLYIEKGLETYDAEVERAAEDSLPPEAASLEATAPLSVLTLQPTLRRLREVVVVLSTKRRKL
jgi:hypothetical protein